MGGSNQGGQGGGARYYQDMSNSAVNGENVNPKVISLGSQNNLNNTIISVPPGSGGPGTATQAKSNSLRPISRDVKLRSQANRNNPSVG